MKAGIHFNIVVLKALTVALSTRLEYKLGLILEIYISLIYLYSGVGSIQFSVLFLV